MLQVIQVTAEYSNAVLIAILPYVNDFVKKMDLPIPIPIVASQIQFNCSWARDESSGIGGSIRFQNGYSCIFDRGIVDYLDSEMSYQSLQNPSRIPEFYGTFRMSKDEAITLCLNTLKKLGHPTEKLERQEPEISSPQLENGKIIPRYFVKWMEKVP